MEIIFTKVCILVTAAFVLTLVPGYRQVERSLLSRRDQSTALLVFLVLGLVEEISFSQAGWINERIVAVCTAGLVAGPWVGLAVSVFVTGMAFAHEGIRLASIATPMVGGGLLGGWLCRWQPKLAQKAWTGFALTLLISLLGGVLMPQATSDSSEPVRGLEQMVERSLLQGLGTALILVIVKQVRERDDQTRAAALAEVRILQARMNPHFIFNALNTLAALSRIAPREVPPAVGQLRRFLRASFDQHDRALVPVEEELAIVNMYLEIELLRFGSRLKVERAIDPVIMKVLLPPFSLQPLVENAVGHGLHSSPEAGRLRLEGRAEEPWLELSVSDDGQGVPATEIERLFFAEGPSAHALTLLRRRLQGLFGRSFQLEVQSERGQGTTVTMRIPLRKQRCAAADERSQLT